MRLCIVSFKECWRDPAGVWMSDGGFPLQMAAIGALFDSTTLLVCQVPAKPGGIPLPKHATVIPLRRPAGADARRKLWVVAHLGYLLRTLSPHLRAADVVHVPLPGDIPLIGMVIALALRKRLIARYGGSWTDTSQTTLMNRVTRTLMRRAAGGRNVMLATGEGAEPPAPGIVWLFATALTRAELEASRPALDRGLASPPRLIYCGRVSAAKGVPQLVDAMALLQRQAAGPLPLLTVAGDGAERAALERRAHAAGCGGLIRFTGQLDRAALAAELAAADVCVHPSLAESSAKAWLDAMAYGVPVIASDVGAARAVFGERGERGWLVAPGDSRALAAAIRRVLCTDIDWPALRRRCRVYIEERTLEDWAPRIGEACARQWGTPLVGGRLGGAS